MGQDALESYLRRLPLSDAQRADIWDLMSSTSSADDLATKLQPLQVPESLKADLWDMKHAEAPKAAPTSFLGQVGNQFTQNVGVGADLAIGALKGLGEGAVQAGKMIHKIPGVTRAVDAFYGQPGLSSLAMNEADTAMDATNTAQRLGKFAEQVGESFLTGAPVLKVGAKATQLGLKAAPYLGARGAGLVSLAGRAGVEAAAGGALSAYQGGDLTTGAALSGALPVAGAAIRGARGFFTGAKLTPQMTNAIRVAEHEGVPLDAATMTARPIVATLQKRAADSMGGAGVAERFQGRQADALAATGRKMAQAIDPTPVTAEEAGRAVRGTIDDTIRKAADKQNVSYGRVRAAEAAAMPDDVPVSRPVAAGRTVDQGFIGHWLADDLNEMGYQAGGGSKKFYDAAERDWLPGDSSAARAGIGIGSGRVAGTPTLEMFQKAGISGSRQQIADRIRRVLTGQSNDKKVLSILDAMGEAWDGQRFDMDLITDDTLARTGLKRRDFKSPMTLPAEDAPGAAKFFEGQTLPPSGTEPVPMAVTLGGVKDALRPIYDQLMRKKELTGQLMGAESRAAVALDALVSGPDAVPLSVADSALSELKTLARGADMPQLRSRGQGIAAKAVKELEAAVQAKAQAAGVWDDLRAGREATIEKWTVAETRDALRDEPVAVFNSLTMARDAGIDRLRAVARIAPQDMPKVGRAYLDGLLDTATAEGGFQRAQGLMAQWQKLGPETKKILFPNAAHRNDLDGFFMLAKKIGENPNPSGTARVLTALNAALFVPTYVLARALYSPKFMKMITTGVTTGSPSLVKDALRRAAVSQMAQAQ